MRSIFWQQILTIYHKNGINITMYKGDGFVVVESINSLKQKLEEQIEKKDSYDRIYETSIKIDKLLIDYYNEYGLGKKV